MRAVGEQRHRVRRQPDPDLCRHQGNVQPGADAKSDAETGGGMVMTVAMVVIVAMIMVVVMVMPMAMLGVIVVVMMRRGHDPLRRPGRCAVIALLPTPGNRLAVRRGPVNDRSA
jgi:hypothetical protein